MLAKQIGNPSLSAAEPGFPAITKSLAKHDYCSHGQHQRTAERDIVSDADLVVYLGDRRSKNLATSAALA
jgi:hypothetical protein